MHSAPPQTLARRLVVSVSAVALFVATASATSAQTVPDLFTRVETLTLSDGTPAVFNGTPVGNVSIGGDTAVVNGTGGVHVFERESRGDHWMHTATLVGGGRPVATDGQTIVVTAEGAALVFQRVPGTHAWQEVARLVGDQNSDSFARSVAVSGRTVVVGAPSGPPSPSGLPTGLGVVYVFERDLGGPNAWGEAARLKGTPAPDPSPAWIDAFGSSVAIDRDTVLVGARTPHEIPPRSSSSPRAYVFSRHAGGQNAWGLVAAPYAGIGSTPGEITPNPDVSISGDTAVISQPHSGTLPLVPFANIIQRDRGGPNAWGTVARLGVRGPVFVSSGWAVGPYVFGRHQGAADAWGEVQRRSGLAISRDTMLARGLLQETGGYVVDVYVADTDRDGLRDGADPCPRDPLNNVAEHCLRASAVHPVLDELIAQGEVTSETQGRRQIVTATFTNTSDTAVQNPFFEVTELTGRNVLLNGDAGRGRIGATLSPDVGDGILSPGESMTVTFEIRLRTRNPFQFFVTLHGDPVPSS